MRLPFIPREERFFDLFQRGSKNLVAAAEALRDLMENYEDVPAKVDHMTELENEGDTVTHEVIGLLHRTFITPFDREDIALLAQRLDDVVDLIEQAAISMNIYKIPHPTQHAKDMAGIILKAANEVDWALVHIRNTSNLKAILEHCVIINTLENEADKVLQLALAELFNDTACAADIIKWREIYQELEDATDRCEDVSNVLEGVVLKHA